MSGLCSTGRQIRGSLCRGEYKMVTHNCCAKCQKNHHFAKIFSSEHVPSRYLSARDIYIYQLPYSPSLFYFHLSLSLLCLQSSIAVYDLETGQKRFQVAVEGGERTVVLVRHLVSLRDTHVACSTGRDIQLLPCNVKLKVD